MKLLEVFKKYFNEAPECSDKVNSDLCKQCAGRCCSNLGCHISPDDLKEISVQSIINFIDESGCISIDWWEGDPITDTPNGKRVYYLRAKSRDSKVIDPGFGENPCSLLTENGCPLPFSYRPKGARELIPNEKKCEEKYLKIQCAIDWLEYQDIMEKVYHHYAEQGEVTMNFFTFLSELFAGEL